MAPFPLNPFSPLYNVQNDTHTYCNSPCIYFRIRHIRYNYSKGYLLIVYESNNMDLLYDDGTIVNLPEIRDASVSASRTVNGSSFGDGTIYLATDFGLVVYDDVRHEVIESGIYNRKLTHAFVLGDHLLVRTSVPDGPFNLFAAPVGGRHNEWSVFRKLDVLDFGSGMTEVVPLSDGTLLHNRAGTGVMRHKYDFDRYEASDVLFTDIPAGSYCDIHPTADGAVFLFGVGMLRRRSCCLSMQTHVLHLPDLRRRCGLSTERPLLATISPGAHRQF